MGWKHNTLIIKCNEMVEGEAFPRGSQNTRMCVCLGLFVGFFDSLSNKDTHTYYGPHNFTSLGQSFWVLHVFPSSSQFALTKFSKGLWFSTCYPSSQCVHQHVLNIASLCSHTLLALSSWNLSLGGPILRFLYFFVLEYIYIYIYIILGSLLRVWFFIYFSMWWANQRGSSQK